MIKYLKQLKVNQFTLPYRRLLITLVIFSFGYLTSINSAIAEEQLLHTLTVTGQGKEIISTTLAQVSLGVEIQGKTATEVQQEVAKRTSAVVDFLRSRNVEQLKTTGIRLQPNYQYNNNERTLIGYIGTNKVSFSFSTEQVGILIDEAVTLGATNIDGVSFTATETAIAAAQKKALSKATLDAQAMADAVLNTLNLTSKEIISIQVNGASVPPPKTIRVEQLSRVADNSSTPVIGGEQTIQASVTLEIRY